MLAVMALLACTSALPAEAPVANPAAPVAAMEQTAPDLFATFLDRGVVADGFGAPVGAGWARCGGGCWRRDRPSPVLAIASGAVVSNEGGALRIHHAWYEDEEPRELVAVYQGVEGGPAAGAVVARGQAIGLSGAFSLRLEGGEGAVDAFLAARPSLPVPLAEARLALISHEARQMRVYDHGAPIASFEVGFGQEEGTKERRGDNRSPRGVYYITDHSRGPFGGDYADFYGGLWMRLNYPNAHDAARGVDQGLITPEQQLAISRAWRARQPTLRDTALGGGIGIHAWIAPWDLDGPRRLSWGCVVVQPVDADAVYAALPVGSMVILF